MFYPAGAGNDVWQKIPWWFKCLLLNLIQMCPNCSDLRILTYSSCLWMRNRVKWASSKLLDSTSNVKLCQSYPGKRSKRCGAGYPGRVWACYSCTHWRGGIVIAAAWTVSFSFLATLPCTSDSTLQYRNSPHFPGLRDGQSWQQNHSGVAFPKNMLCLCLEKAHEEHVTHQVNPQHSGLRSSCAHASTLGAIGGISIVQHTVLLC